MIKVININTGMILAAYTLHSIAPFNPKPWGNLSPESLEHKKAEHAKNMERHEEHNAIIRDEAANTCIILNKQCEASVYKIVNTGDTDNWALAVEAYVSHG